MNTIGIDDNLNRPRIKKMLTIGLIASIITGIGDFLLGYANETSANNFAAGIMSTAPNLSNFQLIAGGLSGMFAIVIEGLAYFGVYRLMADASHDYAHSYRTGIIGYLWLGPIGCHLNVGLMNMAYKYLYQLDPDMAYEAAKPMFYGFSLPVYILMIIFFLLMIIVQYKAFDKGYTPYPRSAKWFNVIVGAIPALLLSVIFGFHTALGAGIGTMFLSFGNAFMFGGLLFTLPSEEVFEAFRKKNVSQNE